MANGLDITRIVYVNLRNPADAQMPFRTVLGKISEVVKKKKIDLALTEQNASTQKTNWFTPTTSDFPITGIAPNMFLPNRVEFRGFDTVDAENSDYQSVPIVNYNVLSNNTDLTAAFYGNPMRMAFNRLNDNLKEMHFRIIYEADFTDNTELDTIITLPSFFDDMVAAESAMNLLLLVADDSAEYQSFVNRYSAVLAANIADWNTRWDKYVKKMRGRSPVIKRTFFSRTSRRGNW